MTKLVDVRDELEHRRTFGFFDDFEWLISPHRWTALAADVGASAAVGDAAGGILALTTGAIDNNEAYVRTTNEVFKFAADKPLVLEARLQFTEANTDDANVIAGVMDAVGADSILDNGAGPKASYSGAVIYKLDGETVWRAQTSIATTKTTTASNKTAGGSSYQVLAIGFRPVSATLAEVVFFVDGEQLRDANGAPFKHQFTYTSATEMQAFAGVKAGGAASEVANIDYLGAYQLR